MKSIILSIVTCGLVAVCLSTSTAKPIGKLTLGDTVKKQKMVMKMAVPVNPQQKKKMAIKKTPKDTTKKQ